MVEATIPAQWYWDSDIYSLERKNIFAHQWLCVGREEEVANPGQFLTGSPAGYPILILRAKEGELRGFHNVCRHRAAKLLSGRNGNYVSLTCPYHGWQYSDNGLLMNTPHFSSSGELSTKEFSLFPLQVETWSGMIFINMDLEAPNLTDWLGPIVSAVKKTAPAWSRAVNARASEQDSCSLPLVHQSPCL